MSLGSGRDGSAMEDGRREEATEADDVEESVEELGGRGFLDSFFGILARGRLW